ncbi:amino acid ABC transporter permease [Clostridium estertheticum]|uniref:ABC transporter permease n=1 Tax=Clostridium estertheticum subsp. estertheticum TaxID=1552 RepID=A0A1J0GLN8_9CLOT|nr:amino acid ABC transporter permease [Clostridium estertheticum]APC41806.1 ABC transporter permease [Clostridium estertheticum subsp. estertheticum]MBU3073354.1 amino acid ABC transporter permease [Clostridium estertheticum]MBU3163405.1 amino acid ABC transporter permease [Clostridium estertheticum]MBX4268121.1 amino acid ABC transporter permease [Clostridium estertheticum]MBZ9616305.1 amino acid ABC transporter permease [Clostridium estertheticum subsp. laramiense]
MANYIDITSYILKGGLLTIEVYVATIIFSIPLGILGALIKVSSLKVLNKAVDIYTWLFRGTPLLLQLFFTYFGLPIIGIKLSPFVAAALTFSLNYGAYFTEIFRSGIQSIDKGQYEAAKVLGMSYRQTMTKIILPQAFKRIIPPMCNEGITLIKDTALLAAIGLQDILRAAREIVTRDFTITPFIIAAIIYLIFTSVVVMAFKKLEKKYSVYE